MGRTHYFADKVHFPDIDFGGGLYHARYFDYFDKARQAFLDDLGFSFADLMLQGATFVLVEANIKYRSPATLGNTLHIYTRVVGKSSRSLTVEQAMTRDKAPVPDGGKPFEDLDSLLCLAKITLVWVDLKNKKAVALPEDLATALEGGRS